MSHELTIYEEFKQDLEAFKAKDAELVFDIETPEGEADCRTYHRALRKVYNGVDKLRKDTGAEYRQKVADINAEAKEILAEIDALASPRKALLDAKDARIQKQIDELAEANRLQAEKDENEREAYIDNQAWDNAKIAADLKAQQDAIDKQKADIAEQKRIEEAKAEAVEEAKRQAAQDAKDAAEKAEREKQEAIEEEKRKAKAEADRKAKEIADKYAKEQAEKERLAKIERERVANDEHRRIIKQEAFDALIEIADISRVDAEAVIDAIAAGQIVNVTINY